MSRPYKEWRAAYNQWKSSYYAGISSIQPNPRGSVVYTERSSNPFWARRQDRVEESLGYSITTVSAKMPELKNISANLIALGEAEFEKEKAALKRLVPDFDIESIEDELQFIQQFNIIIQGKEHYKTMIERLNKVLNDNGNKNSLAPVVSSMFTSKLGTTLNQEIIGLLKQFDANTDPDVWYTEYQAAVDRAIDRAMDGILQPSKHESNKIFGSAEEYKDILALWRKDPLMQTQFKKTIRSKINFDKIFDQIKENTLWQDRAKQGKKVGLRSKLIDGKAGLNLSNSKRTGQIGGSVYQYIQRLFDQAQLNVLVTENGSTVSGQVMKGETMRTDMITILAVNTEFDVDADTLVTEFNNTVSQSTSLKDASRLIEEFYNRNLANLQDGFIMYESAKAYGTSVKGRGFKNGEALPLDRLGDYAADAGVPIGSVEDFLLTAYNTLSGAIYDAARGEVTEAIRNILYAAAAKLLFDDWVSIGSGSSGGIEFDDGTTVGGAGGITAIHVFPLTGIYVPGSYLFKSLGTALGSAGELDPKDWFDVKIKLPTTKTYETKGGNGQPNGNLIGPAGGGSDLEIKKQILEEWNNQFDKAKSESEFEIHFLKNFSSLIGKLAGLKI